MAGHGSAWVEFLNHDVTSRLHVGAGEVAFVHFIARYQPRHPKALDAQASAIRRR